MKVITWGITLSHLVLFYFQSFHVKIVMFCLIFIALMVAFRWRDRRDKVKRQCKILQVARIEEQYEIGKSCILFESSREVQEIENFQEFICGNKKPEELSGSPSAYVAELPEQIWKQILNNLTESADFVACANTCRLFRVLLQNKIRTEAFRLVNDHLTKNSYERLTKQDILNSRLVSKSWKESVDAYLQNHSSHVTDEKDGFPDTVIDSLDIRNVEGLLHRLVDQGRNQSNPFPSRHLQITIHSDLMMEGDQKIFHAAVYLILKYFGKHLWYMTVTINTESHAVQLYEQIYEYFGKTPNLKMIRFKVNSINDNGEDTEIFHEFVRNHEFPKLGHLIEAKFNGLPASITESFLKSNQRRKLTVRG